MANKQNFPLAIYAYSVSMKGINAKTGENISNKVVLHNH